MRSAATVLALAFATLAASQDVTVPTTCGNFTAGTDEVLFTVPYTYDEVMSIIGNYSNLTWSGSPEGSVTLNGTDNTVGVARTYDLMGLHIIEVILEYSKPASPGPYNEVHNTALLTIPTANNLEIFIPYDGTVVTSVCDGKASMFNFTAHFCSSNADTSIGGGLLHMLHLGDAETVGKFLGGQNYTGCEALGANAGAGPANATAALSSATPSGSSAPMATTGAAARYQATMLGGAAAVVAAVFMM